MTRETKLKRPSIDTYFPRGRVHAAPMAQGVTDNHDDIRLILDAFINPRPRIVYSRFTAAQLNNRSGAYGVFGAAIGKPIPDSQGRADIAWTNMVGENLFYPPYCLIATGIMILLDAHMSKEELSQFGSNVVGEFSILGKYFEQIPAALCTVVAGGDLTDLVDPETGDPAETITSLYFSIKPVYIPPLCHFDFKLTHPNWKAPEDLGGYILLDGISEIPIS